MSVTDEARARAARAERLPSAQLDSVAQRAAAERWSYTHFLGHLLDGELRTRHPKRVELNIQFAKFPVQKDFDGFDFGAQPGVDKRLVDELRTGRYLEEGRNVILLGPPFSTSKVRAIASKTAEKRVSPSKNHCQSRNTHPF